MLTRTHHNAAHIADDTTFVHAIDHGSFPNLESAHAPPLHALVRLGPELSSERCRLYLLAEQLCDAVAARPPKEYKPARPNDVAPRDRACLAEALARLHASLAELLLRRRPDRLLTGAEHKHLSALSLLAALLRAALDHPRADPSAPPGLAPAAAGLRSSLAALRAEVLSAPAAPAGGDALLHALAGPHAHALSLLRDAALAARHGAALLLALHAADQARDRSGRSGLHKEAVAEAKALEDLAGKTLAEAREGVRAVKEELGLGGWLDRVEGWMFPAQVAEETERDGLGELVMDVVGSADVEEWTGKVVESWREGVKGFVMAKWE